MARGVVIEAFNTLDEIILRSKITPPELGVDPWLLYYFSSSLMADQLKANTNDYNRIYLVFMLTLVVSKT